MTQKRMKYLFENMIEWICEHISDKSDLALAFHHIGFNDEELLENEVDVYDAR